MGSGSDGETKEKPCALRIWKTGRLLILISIVLTHLSLQRGCNSSEISFFSIAQRTVQQPRHSHIFWPTWHICLLHVPVPVCHPSPFIHEPERAGTAGLWRDCEAQGMPRPRFTADTRCLRTFFMQIKRKTNTANVRDLKRSRFKEWLKRRVILKASCHSPQLSKPLPVSKISLLLFIKTAGRDGRPDSAFLENLKVPLPQQSTKHSNRLPYARWSFCAIWAPCQILGTLRTKP